MASMKTMMMMTLDVGPSMKNPVSSSSKCNKIDLAKAFMGHFILQRMMASKTVEFGVATFGDDETNNFLNGNQGGYEGVNEVWPMCRPTPETLTSIHNIELGSEPGDLIDGIVVSQDTLIRVNQGKAFNRLMLIITDGETEVQGVGDLEEIVTQMRTVKNFAVYIALIGKVNPSSSITKQENAKLLKSIASNVNGRYMEIEDLAESFHLLSAGLGLGTKPVVSKTILEVSPNLKIPVCYWSKVSKATAPTLKKQNKNTPPQAESVVKRDISYRNPEDPDQEIPEEEKVKGFKYGNQYVPVNSADEEKFKIPGSPIIRVIGFIPSTNIPRFHYLDGPTYVYPSQDLDVAHAAVQAFSTAMKEKDRVALVRFVKRDSSDPALMVLIPKKDHLDRDCFLMHRIPCAEDIREFNFPSLISFASDNQVRNNATLRTQKGAMSSFVRSMVIHNPNQQMLSCTNPSLHRVYADIHRRVINENEELMVAVDGGFKSFDTPEVSASLAEMNKHFPLKRSEKSTDRKKVFWSDIEIKTTAETDGNGRIKIEIDGQQIAAALSGQAAVANATAASGVGTVDLPDFTVGSVTPTEDLEQLIEAVKNSSLGDVEKRTKIVEALLVMTKVIERNITVGASKPHYKRAVECLSSLRSIAIREKDADVYNAFLRNTMKGVFSKGRHTMVWQMVVDEKLSLISSNDVTTSTVSVTEAKEFFNEKFVVEVPVTAVIVADEEEDLFGNME
jgi:ATP-dependent DNA helicase 2 subunit 2